MEVGVEGFERGETDQEINLLREKNDKMMKREGRGNERQRKEEIEKRDLVCWTVKKEDDKVEGERAVKTTS